MLISTVPMLPLTSVLLVDDDSTANFLHQLLLTRTLGVTEQVLVAENGQQALAQLGPGASPTPQLILLDLNMPVMNGWEFLTAYQQLPPVTPRPILVLLSSSDQDLLQARTQELPVDAILSKPLTREKVLALLQRHFSAA
jgi:CheY-like chemotaxis protein